MHRQNRIANLISHFGINGYQIFTLIGRAHDASTRKSEVKPLADVLDAAIDHVGDQRERFQRLVELFEAILAYHTKYGGK